MKTIITVIVVIAFMAGYLTCYFTEQRYENCITGSYSYEKITPATSTENSDYLQTVKIGQEWYYVPENPFRKDTFFIKVTDIRDGWVEFSFAPEYNIKSSERLTVFLESRNEVKK